MVDGQAVTLLFPDVVPVASTASGSLVEGLCAESGAQVEAPPADFAGLILELLGSETSGSEAADDEAVPAEVVEDGPEDRSPAEEVVALPDLRALQPPLLQQAAPASTAPNPTLPRVLQVEPTAPSVQPAIQQVTPGVEDSPRVISAEEPWARAPVFRHQEAEVQQTAPVAPALEPETIAVPPVTFGAEKVRAEGAAQVGVSAVTPAVKETGAASDESSVAVQRPTRSEGPQRLADQPESTRVPFSPAVTLTIPGEAEVVPTTPASPLAEAAETPVAPASEAKAPAVPVSLQSPVAAPEVVETPSLRPEAMPTAPVAEVVAEPSEMVARDARPALEATQANQADQRHRPTVQTSSPTPEATLEVPQPTGAPSAVRVATAASTPPVVTQAAQTVQQGDAPRRIAADRPQVTVSQQPEVPVLQTAGNVQETPAQPIGDIAASAPEVAEAALAEASSVTVRTAERAVTDATLQTPEVGVQLPRSQSPVGTTDGTAIENPQGIPLPLPSVARTVASPPAQQVLMTSQSLAAEETVASQETVGRSLAGRARASGPTQRRVAAPAETTPVTTGTVSALPVEVSAERAVTPVEAAQRAVQLAEALHAQVGTRGGRVKLHLPWDDLGVQSVTVEVAGRRAEVDLLFTEAQALDLRVLETPLRERLQAHGLTLESFTMSFGEGQSSGGQWRGEYNPTSPSPLREEPRNNPSTPHPRAVYRERSSSGVLDLFA